MPLFVLVGFSKHRYNTPPLRGSKRHSVNRAAPTHLPPYLMQAMASTRESMKTEPIWQGETSQVTWSSTGGTCCGLLGSPLNPIQMTQDLVLVGETIPCPNQVLSCVGPEDEYRIGQVRQNPGCRHDPGNQEKLVHELSCPWKSTCPCQVSCVALQVGESDRLQGSPDLMELWMSRLQGISWQPCTDARSLLWPRNQSWTRRRGTVIL